MRAPRRYEFRDRLVMSQGVAATADVTQILLDEIPGSVRVDRARPSEDRNGIDWWVIMSGGRRPLGVDLKWRSKDYGQDDLALETWSVIERNIPGWTRDQNKHTDYVLWLFDGAPGRFCLFPFPMLCAVFQRRWAGWWERYKHSQQQTPLSNGHAYHSECVFVPIREIWREIYRTFSGMPQGK